MSRMCILHEDYKLSYYFIKKGLKISRKQKNIEKEIIFLLDGALVLNSQYLYVDAERLCKLSLELQDQIYYENHPIKAQSLRILATIYTQQDKHELTVLILQKAIKIMSTSHLSNDVNMIYFYKDIARAYMELGKFIKAKYYYVLELGALDNCLNIRVKNEYKIDIFNDINKIEILKNKEHNLIKK